MVFQLIKRSSLVLAVAALAVGCSSTQPPETQLTDAGITAKVEAKIAADPELNPFEIDIDTNEGVVRLSGRVDEASDRAEAEKLARRTDGVQSVVNDLTLGDKTVGEGVDDAVIITRVKARLAADPEINPFDIDVDAEDGVVTLMGRVESRGDKAEAERLAWEVDGVRQVANRLKIGDIS